MRNLTDMIWIEFRKAYRSKMPLWTLLGSLLMPFGVAFLIFVARNPAISQKLGLISVKADLVAYSATDWQAYFGLTGMIIAAGGFFFFVLATSWIFGREFADGTVKDMLAVPVPRSSILSAKFITAFLWSLAITIAMTTVSLGMGAILNLPGGSPAVISGGLALILVTALLTIAAALTFALIASMGRGYLLSIGLAILTVMMANLIAVTGRGEYFPWAVAGIYAHEPTSVTAVSFVLVVLTFAVAVLLTNWWWHKADQNK